MSDQELRSLERAVTEKAPGALEKLGVARVRAGLGWFGENVVSLASEHGSLRVLSRRPLYQWVDTKNQIAIEMVYVPGTHKTTCQLCTRIYRGATFTATWKDERGTQHIGCPNCDDTKVREVTPFYISRYPILMREFGAFRRPPVPARGLSPIHPIVMVPHSLAKKFCEWSGLRLPHGEEWEVAALGTWKWGKIKTSETQDGVRARRLGRRLQDGMRAKAEWISTITDEAVNHLRIRTEQETIFYPWGTEPPTRNRCVSSYSDGALPGSHEATSMAVFAPFPAIVERDGMEQPGRPDGLSWCGAADMVGNVWQYLSDGAAIGGSFSTLPVLKPGGRFDQPAGTELGFRVVLSGAA